MKRVEECPRCGEPISPDALYGPCKACRGVLRVWAVREGLRIREAARKRAREREDDDDDDD